MTRDEFINRFKHEWAGLILDAALESRKGPEFSIWVRMVLGKVNQRLGEEYEALTRKPVPENGQPAQPTQVRKT